MVVVVPVVVVEVVVVDVVVVGLVDIAWTSTSRAATDEPVAQPSALTRTVWPAAPTVTVTTWPGASELCSPAFVTVTVKVCGEEVVPRTCVRWQDGVVEVPVVAVDVDVDLWPWLPESARANDAPTPAAPTSTNSTILSFTRSPSGVS